MPRALVEPCILAGSEPGDLVLDPFSGAGTVGLVALQHRRRFVGIELLADYRALALRRIARSLEGKPDLLEEPAAGEEAAAP
jgi:DNA modification methylase